MEALQPHELSNVQSSTSRIPIAQDMDCGRICMSATGERVKDEGKQQILGTARSLNMRVASVSKSLTSADEVHRQSRVEAGEVCHERWLHGQSQSPVGGCSPPGRTHGASGVSTVALVRLRMAPTASATKKKGARPSSSNRSWKATQTQNHERCQHGRGIHGPPHSNLEHWHKSGADLSVLETVQRNDTSQRKLGKTPVDGGGAQQDEIRKQQTVCDEALIFGARVTRSGFPGKKQLQRVENTKNVWLCWTERNEWDGSESCATQRSHTGGSQQPPQTT